MLKLEGHSLLVINRMMWVYQTKETSFYNPPLTSEKNKSFNSVSSQEITYMSFIYEKRGVLNFFFPCTIRYYY